MDQSTVEENSTPSKDALGVPDKGHPMLSASEKESETVAEVAKPKRSLPGGSVIGGRSAAKLSQKEPALQLSQREPASGSAPENLRGRKDGYRKLSSSFEVTCNPDGGPAIKRRSAEKPSQTEPASSSAPVKSKSKKGGHKTASSSFDLEILKKVPWSIAAEPVLSVDERVTAYKQWVSDRDSTAQKWLNDGKPTCETEGCGKKHPPPHLEQELFRAYRSEGRAAQREQEKAASASASDEKGESSSLTRGLEHYRRWHNSADAQARFAEVGLGQDEASGPDDIVEKFALYWDEFDTSQAADAGKVFNYLVGDKRKQPPKDDDHGGGKKSKH